MKPKVFKQYHGASYAAGKWDVLWYEKNIFGDIVAIYNESGTKLISYRYGAYGTCTPQLHVYSDAAYNNPFRYRGYYYDTDLNLYYLNSRYYDSFTGRFISADNFDTVCATPNALTDKNLFAYCDNNPVSRKDPNGGFWVTMVIGGLIGTAISAISSAVTQQALTGTVNWKSVGVAAATGFVSGAIAASPLGLAGQMIAGGVIGGLSYAADSYVNDNEMKLDEALLSVGMGVVSGLIGGAGANKKMVLSNAAKSAKQTIAREGRRANQQYAQKVIASTISARNSMFSSTALNSSFKFAVGSGVSNGVTGIYSSLGWFPNLPAWKPW